MLLAYQEKDMMSEENQPPYPFPLVNISRYVHTIAVVYTYVVKHETFMAFIDFQ